MARRGLMWTVAAKPPHPLGDAYPMRTAIDKGNNHFISSLAPATVLAHLAVASLGLGSQWVSNVSSPYMSTMLKAWLGIPRHVKISDMFGVGYPANVPPVTKRRELDEIVHHERYEESKARDIETLRFLSGDTLRGGLVAMTGFKDRAGHPRRLRLRDRRTPARGARRDALT
jgi:hypothetical protein